MPVFQARPGLLELDDLQPAPAPGGPHVPTGPGWFSPEALGAVVGEPPVAPNVYENPALVRFFEELGEPVPESEPEPVDPRISGISPRGVPIGRFRHHIVDPAIAALRRGAEDRLRLEATGVDVPGGPFSTAPQSEARALFSMGRGAYSDIELARLALTTAYDSGVAGTARQDDGGNIVFMHPKTGKDTVFNPPGLDVSDLAAAVPLIGEIATDLVTGAVALWAPKKGPKATVAKVAGLNAFGNYLFTIRRLKEFNARTDAELTIEQMHSIGLKSAGLTALGAAGVPFLFWGARKIFGRVPRNVAPHLTTEEVEEALVFEARLQEELRERMSDVVPGHGPADVPGALGALVGRQVRGGGQPILTAGQATGVSDLVAVERQLEALGHPSLRDVFDRQAVIEDRLLEIVGPEAGVQLGRGASEVQEALRRIFPGDAFLNENQKAMEDAMTLAINEWGRAVGVRAETPIRSGEAVHAHLAQARRSAFEPFRERYTEIENLGEGLEISLGPLRSAAAPISGELANDILRIVSTEDINVIQNAAAAGLKKETRLVGLGETLEFVWKEMSTDNPVSLSQVSRALSDLKAYARRTDLSKKYKADLGQLIDGLQTSRDNALAHNPELLRQVRSVDAAYRRYKEIFDRGIVGQLLETDQYGAPVVQFERILPNIMGSETYAQEIGRLLNNPAIAQRAGLRNRLMNGLYGMYKEQVTDSAGDYLSGDKMRAAHNAFQKKYWDSVNLLFSQGPGGDVYAPTFTDVAGPLGLGPQAMLSSIRSYERAVESADSALLEKFRIKAKDLDAGFITTLYDERATEELIKLSNILRALPEQQAMFKNVLRNEILKSITTSPRGGVKGRSAAAYVRVPDTAKLVEFLEHGGSFEIARLVGGQSYIDDLNFMKGVMQRFDAETPRQATTLVEGLNPAKFTMGGMWSLAKSALVPPLSQRGRMTTEVIRQLGSRQEAAVARLLANPEHLRLYIKHRNSPLSDPGVQAILGSIGMAVLAEDYQNAIGNLPKQAYPFGERMILGGAGVLGDVAGAVVGAFND